MIIVKKSLSISRRKFSINITFEIFNLNNFKDVGETFEITDNSLVLSNLNGMRRGGPQFVHWECAEWRERGGASGWGTWRPSNGDR